MIRFRRALYELTRASFMTLMIVDIAIAALHYVAARAVDAAAYQRHFITV